MPDQVRTQITPDRAPSGSSPNNRDDSNALEQIVELGVEPFLLRPIRPEDGGGYSDFISRIAESDLRLRFVRDQDRWADKQLLRDTQFDSDREISFVAVRQSGPGSGDIVGEVRAYLCPGRTMAEAAIVVRSDMKRRGLGRALMERIIAYCRRNGLELIGRILPENTAMIRLAEGCGMEVEHRPGTDFAVAYLGAEGPRSRERPWCP